MTSGRHQVDAQDELNLFPFLAVLICTMGALIVLLVVIVQQARSRARNLAQEPPPGANATQTNSEKLQVRHLQEEREHYQWQAELLQESYQQTVAQVIERRLVLSHLEDHYRQLLKQLRNLRAEAAEIEQARNDQSKNQDDVESVLAGLRQQIQDAGERLAQVQQERSQESKSFALVPYDGPNGTQRRPIYIECLEDRVLLRPENITLEADDFLEPLGPDNPLAAALRAKREFWLTRGIVSVDSEPYPLIVVRPQGAASYAAARGAMKSWEAEFGYELVEDDVRLEFPPADPHLLEVMNQAVQQARARRRLLRLAAPTRGVRGERNVYLTASPRGGFVRTGERTGDGDAPETGPESEPDGAAPPAEGQRAEGRRRGWSGQAEQAARETLGSAPPSHSAPTGYLNSEPSAGNVAGIASLAQARGVDWALPNKTADAVGITRPLRVLCDVERLVLIPERGTGQKPTVLVHRGHVRDKIDEFVDAVRRRQDSWGIAGNGVYWKPTLHIVIADGAVSTYAELTSLLRDSGIETLRVP